MKPAPFTYHDPKTVADAIGLLARLENAKLLAGGQSLMPMLNMRFVQPDHVIDLNGVAGLDGIDDAGGRLELGAMVRQHALEVSDMVRRRCPLMAEALAFVGHRPTRNRGTLGGSLAHLDPAAELPLVALVHDASVRVAGAKGSREVAMTDFPAAYMTPAIEADEMVTGVALRPWAAGHGHAFLEFARRHGDFAIVAVAALLEVSGKGAIARAALALGGVESVPRAVPEAAAMLVGAEGGADAFRAAAERAASLDSFTDVHASADDRRHLVGVLVRRALALAYRRARDDRR